MNSLNLTPMQIGSWYLTPNTEKLSVSLLTNHNSELHMLPLIIPTLNLGSPSLQSSVVSQMENCLPASQIQSPPTFFANTFTHGININRVKATVMHNFQDYLLRQLSRLKSSSETDQIFVLFTPNVARAPTEFGTTTFTLTLQWSSLLLWHCPGSTIM